MSWLEDRTFAGVVRRQERGALVLEITVQGAVVDMPSGGLLSIWMEEVAIVEGAPGRVAGVRRSPTCRPITPRSGPAFAATRKYQGRFNYRQGFMSGNWHEIREDGSLVAGGAGGFQLACPKSRSRAQKGGAPAVH